MMPDLRGWLPIGVSWREDAVEIDWRLFGSARLTEPFFEDSVRRITTRPFNQAFRRQTEIAVLEHWAAASPGITPSGFIFHMSRCGSTLVTQMLAARDDSVVISEAPPIDVLLCGGVATNDDRIRWLRALVSALGQPRGGGERHLIMKFDCWHIGQLPLIARAFPETPWVFLYREPRAVLASHLRQRGVHTVPTLVDPAHFGLSLDEALATPPADYCARVLGTTCVAAADAMDGRFGMETAARGLLVNYADLPNAVIDEILPYFGVDSTPDACATMLAVAQRHSKRPEQNFSSALDAPPLSAEAEAAVAWHMDAAYTRLEALRAQSGPA